MAFRQENPAEHLPLSPAVVHILLALADEERHGYGIMLEIERRTGGSFRPGSGTLYGTLKRLLASRLVEESGERPDPELDDSRRRYYRLTGLGRRVLEAEMKRLEQLVGVGRVKKLLPRSAST
jgi:DNA-binding PadR family transcriptional regulator